MLKIKDNVDLKELEKFGFKQVDTNIFIKIDKTNFYCNIIMIDAYRRFWASTRRTEVYDTNTEFYLDDFFLTTVAELANFGLVEIEM